MAKQVLIYCRESRDDGFVNYDRIETQCEILKNFCQKQELGEIKAIVMDDNKSGTSFERLLPIREMIHRREVDIFLCKDASRLGRNILESLSFTEFLSQNGVQLIFESERYDEDVFPLIAWFNERRVKDDSQKIRRVLRHKMEMGSMVIKAPYGFVKVGHTLQINEAAAAVVREIFEMYLANKTLQEIADALNQRKCLTPSQILAQKGNAAQSCLWNTQHIRRILKTRAYMGDMVYGMREKVSYKSKKYRAKPPDSWVVVPDHHEAIIALAVFEEAQEKLNHRRSGKAIPNKTTIL